MRPFDGALFLISLAIYATARVPLGATREKLDRLGSINIYNALTAMLLIGSLVTIGISWWAARLKATPIT